MLTNVCKKYAKVKKNKKYLGMSFEIYNFALKQDGRECKNT